MPGGTLSGTGVIDLSLDEKTRALREMARWLGREQLRPLGIECDERHAPLPPDHPFFTTVLEFGVGGRGLAGIAGDAQAAEGASPARTSKAARRTVVIAEEIAYWDRGMATTLPGPGLGGAPVALLGTEEQKERLFAPFSDRKKPHWAAFAMSEPGAGSDVARIRTLAREVEGGFELTGEKMFISNGARADWAVVWATIDPALGREGHRAFVVERGTPGFTVTRIEQKMGLAAAELASLSFEAAFVPDRNVLPAREGGFKAAMRTFDITRPMVGAMAVGIGQAAFDETLRLARESGLLTGGAATTVRLRDKLARARRLVDHARLLCWRAAWLADLKRPNSVEASMAKAYAPRAALEAASLGMEVLGAAGARSDRLVEKLFRDVKVLDIVEGTGEIQRLAMARKLLGFSSEAAPEIT